jgi:hypothetical protein
MHGKKMLPKKDGRQEQPKKPYMTPKLIIHGSLKEITGKIPGGSDGSGRKAHS